MSCSSVHIPPRWSPFTVVSVISLALILVMLGYALRESRIANPTTHRRRMITIVALGAVSAFLVFGWAFLP
ncbi:MAG: hypothetical protein HQ581_27740 [Planctomycetes bacterium]|nr:hypothetical protein [Planctomycetota bacterium]